MIKKLLFLTMFVLGWAISSVAETTEAVFIPLEIVDESENGNSDPKSPQLLFVMQDNNVLSMTQASSNLVLQLRDDMGNVVYSVFLPAGTAQVVLPATLFGTFELRLVANTYYYWGYIAL